MIVKRDGISNVRCSFCLIWLMAFVFLMIQCDLIKKEDINNINEDTQPPVEVYWILSIGGSGRDYAPSFCITNNGYVIVGMSTSYGLGNGGNNLNGSHDFFAVKLNKNGEHVWSSTIGGTNDERGSYSVSKTTDSGFLLTGSTRSFGAGQTDLFMVKLNASGALVWAKSIGGLGMESGKTTLEVSDGYITVGETDSFGAGKQDILVVKLKSTGTLEWAKAIGGLENDKGSGIEEVSGGYIIGATIESFGAGEADACLIKINKQGNIIWSKTIGGSKGEGINWDGIRVTSDGGYCFGDATGSFGAKGNGAFFGIKLKSDGSLEWSTLIDGQQEDAGWTMNEINDGYIAGGKYTITGNGGDVLIIKFNKSGDFLWSRTLGKTGLDEIEEIKPLDNGFLMTGVTRMEDAAGDFLVAKINTSGFVGGNADPINTLSPNSVVSISPQIISFSPSVTDISSQISISSVSPTVTIPSIQIKKIY